MSWNSNRMLIFLVGMVLMFCSTPTEEKHAIEEEPTQLSNLYLLGVEAAEEALNMSGYKLIDFRKPEQYASGHLPGAINIWRADIENPAFEYGGMMASRKQIETLFSERGITSTDTLIIYDDNGLCDAARMWWVLQNHGFTGVKLLHGGLVGWKKGAGNLEVGDVTLPATDFRFQKPEEARFIISKEELLEALKGKPLVIDARSSDEFSGKRQKKGASKGGRIPGSIHIDWASAIDYHGDLRIKPVEELRKVYYQLPDDRGEPIIVYCHSGVRSAHTTFVLTQLLGYKNVRNYDGSWTEWSYYDDLPFEQDSVTTVID